MRIPGQLRRDAYEMHNRDGIPLHPNLVATLADIAEELGIPKLS